jgi:hypothetical protein
VHDSILVSLAILNVNWDETHSSYVHNYVPFVADCLQRSSSEYVSIPELQAALENDFGLRLPQPAIQGIVGRAARDGLLVRERGVLRTNREALAGYDLTAKRTAAVREHEALVSKFVEFARSRGDARGR